LTNDAIHRFTQDHTYVQELVKMGRISASDAPLHPNRNILTQAMGTQALLHFDKGKLETPFRRNNILMICSDGLSEYLNENEIATILAAHELREAGNEMVEKAMQRGGRDNITVVLAKKMD